MVDDSAAFEAQGIAEASQGMWCCSGPAGIVSGRAIPKPRSNARRIRPSVTLESPASVRKSATPWQPARSPRWGPIPGDESQWTHPKTLRSRLPLATGTSASGRASATSNILTWMCGRRKKSRSFCAPGRRSSSSVPRTRWGTLLRPGKRAVCAWYRGERPAPGVPVTFESAQKVHAGTGKGASGTEKQWTRRAAVSGDGKRLMDNRR